MSLSSFFKNLVSSPLPEHYQVTEKYGSDVNYVWEQTNFWPETIAEIVSKVDRMHDNPDDFSRNDLLKIVRATIDMQPEEADKFIAAYEPSNKNGYNKFAISGPPSAWHR